MKRFAQAFLLLAVAGCNATSSAQPRLARQEAPGFDAMMAIMGQRYEDIPTAEINAALGRPSDAFLIPARTNRLRFESDKMDVILPPDPTLPTLDPDPRCQWMDGDSRVDWMIFMACYQYVSEGHDPDCAEPGIEVQYEWRRSGPVIHVEVTGVHIHCQQ